mmetsp:Transcript_95878/g.273378  ORF Transcript_95878/g.273378 Transcript_95878/m.273378 type:complete len:141 (+) Transcript_95878:138-560(+)
MAKLIDQLIPARFLLTIGHFIALMMVIYTREENIYAAYDNNPSSSVMDGDKRTMNDAIIVGAVCLGCDMWGLFQSSLFMNKVNMLQIILHFMGGVAVSTFIQNQWPYPYLWVLVALFNVPTALVEFSIIMAVNCFGIVII